jgi:hypothetical protein
MGLGICRSDIIEARAKLRKREAERCQILAMIPAPHDPPAYLVPPRNATRWQPRGDLTIPIAPAGVDQLVFSERMDLGYDGIITSPSNIWAGTGFIEASGDITWRIKKDRVFIPYYDTITVSLGSLAVPFLVGLEGIPVLSGQLIQYFVNFQAGSEGRLNVGGKTVCAFTGYKWARDTRAAIL